MRVRQVPNTFNYFFVEHAFPFVEMHAQEKCFLHMGQGFPHQLPVLENVILHPPCKTSRVRLRHDFPCTTFVHNCIYFAEFWS